MNSATVIFPHQLFENHPALKKNRPVYLIEDKRFFTDFNYHKQKLVLHRASLKAFQDFLIEEGYMVHYCQYNQNLFDILTAKNIKQIHLAIVADTVLEARIKHSAAKYDILIQYYQTQCFLNTQERIEELFDKNKNHYSMNQFYIKQRIYFDILVEKNNKPTGGKWTFDTENRKKLPSGIKQPNLQIPKKNKYVIEALAYVKANFPKNPGLSKNFIYPITFLDARSWLDNFLHDRFKLFGPYQDAIDNNNPILFHSVLSPLLNTGLLTPDYVIKRTLEYAQKNNTPLPSLEGFIRQILGWREFVYGIYCINGALQRNSNFFNHKTQLPNSFWSAQTMILPVDKIISQVNELAYAHHIARLMIMGNFMLLCKINPNDIYKWFMELFIDAYDWVMVPNVYGMSQYADAGLIITKPYISSSNYIKKMSNFKSGPWANIWDSLFWSFIYYHRNFIATVPRLAVMNHLLERMPKMKLKTYLATANGYLEQHFT